MPRPLLVAGILLATICLAGVTRGGPAQRAPVLAKYGLTGPLEPDLIPDTLQTLAASEDIAAKIEAPLYFDAFFKTKFFSDQSFYVDLLAGVDVAAGAWAQRHGTIPSENAYRATVCIYSYPLPGCPPKSRSNQDKMTRVRQQLLVGVYGSADRRASLQSRLRPRFLDLPNIEGINLESVDIDEYIRVNDLF